MSLAAACAGWLTAGLVAASWLLMHRAVNSRMEAVARACHELRGPITAARLGVELGTRGGELSCAQLRAIHSELGRATLALEDLAVAPECRMAPRAFELVDIGELLSDSVHAWRPAAARAGVELRLLCRMPMPRVRGDRLRLAQAAGNLIANAIEHGARHVHVLGCTSGTGTRIEIVDDGPGLPAPLSEIVGRARRGRGARGRGLAIATAIAALHGGRLIAAPADAGAHLVLDLPAGGAGIPDGPTGLSSDRASGASALPGDGTGAGLPDGPTVRLSNCVTDGRTGLWGQGASRSG